MNIKTEITFLDVDALDVVNSYIENATYTKEGFEGAIKEVLEGYDFDTVINIDEIAKECIKELTKVLTFDDSNKDS